MLLEKINHRLSRWKLKLYIIAVKGGWDFKMEMRSISRKRKNRDRLAQNKKPARQGADSFFLFVWVLRLFTRKRLFKESRCEGAPCTDIRIDSGEIVAETDLIGGDGQAMPAEWIDAQFGVDA